MKSEQFETSSLILTDEMNNGGEIHQNTSLHERPSLYLLHGNDLLLSRKAIVELMTAVLSKGKGFRFRARGWSMSPFVKDGDVIGVSPIGSQAPKMGEIVAFDRPERSGLVVHRLIGRQGDKWMIQGDNTPTEAVELVPQEKILGRITSVHRNGRLVWSGNGPERYLIAWLSRLSLLGPVLFSARNLRIRLANLHDTFRGKG